MVLGYKPFLISVSLLPLFNHLSIIHSLFRLHLDFEIELPLQPVCELHFYILICFSGAYSLVATVFAVSVPGCSYVRPELVPATGTYTSSALCAAYLPLHKKSPMSVPLGRKRKSPRRIFQSRYQLRIRLFFLNSVHFFVRFSVT